MNPRESEEMSLIGPESSNDSKLWNSTATLFQGEDEFRVSFGAGISLCIAYGLIFIFGIVGNSFVVAVVVRSPRMRNTTNFFIVNLALADLLVVVLCIPTTLISNIYTCKTLIMISQHSEVLTF